MRETLAKWALMGSFGAWSAQCIPSDQGITREKVHLFEGLWCDSFSRNRSLAAGDERHL